MQLELLTYTPTQGWSLRPFPPLDSERTVVVIFGASAFADDPAPIRDLLAAYPRSHVIGCSTSGEIFGASLVDGTLSAAIARFEHSDLATASAAVRSPEESFEAGERVADALTREDLRAILILSDGLNVNGSELVRGFNSKLPESVVVTGGLAGDGDRFQRTWVVGRNGPEQGIVSAIGLYGDRVRVGHGSRGGWDIFGPERLVTASKDNVLFELDGKPALQLYKQYLGERASGLPATALLFPLALRASQGDKKVLVRTVLSVDEASQSMTFAGNVPKGHLAQLMRANFERLIEGASGAALHAGESSVARIRPTNMAVAQPGGEAGQTDLLSTAPPLLPACSRDTLAIAISCVGRRLVLGERTEEEIEAALRSLPAGTRQIGFYSYGEISPYASGHCDLHNQTMTLTTFSED